MISVLEILEKTTAFLERKGVSQARLDAEWMLADTLGCGRMQLYLQFDRPLNEEVLEQMRQRVRRRGEREPLAYILGWAPFRNLRLKVDPRGLIPRPETEYLLDLLPSHLPGAPHRCLDLGCGPGTLALAIAAEYPGAKVTGVDSSIKALSLARENGQANSLEVSWVQSDWFEAVTGTFDLIVSNPPYLTPEEWSSSDPEVRLHEPQEALIGGSDGLVDLRTILEQAKRFLCPGGLLALETGPDQHVALTEYAQKEGWGRVESLRDLARRPRYLFLSHTAES